MEPRTTIDAVLEAAGSFPGVLLVALAILLAAACAVYAVTR